MNSGYPMIDARRAEGCLTVEMEAASLLAVDACLEM